MAGVNYDAEELNKLINLIDDGVAKVAVFRSQGLPEDKLINVINGCYSSVYSTFINCFYNTCDASL